MKEDDDFFDNKFFEYVKKLKSRPRQRASYFEASDKKSKEMSVVNNLLQTEDSWGIKKLEFPMNDPPDVVGTTELGIQIGFEVTELVNQDANALEARKNKRLHDGHRDFVPRKKQLDMEIQLIDEELQWNVDKILSLLKYTISKKDNKLANIRDEFEEIVLVVFSDENQIYHKNVIDALLAFNWEPPHNIDEIWLIRAPVTHNVRNNVFKLL